MRGFVFTLDTLLAAGVLFVLLAGSFAALSQVQPAQTPQKYGKDLLTVWEKGGLNSTQLRDWLLSSGRCGSFVLRDSAGKAADGWSACSCDGSLSAKRSLALANGSLYIAELSWCTRGS